MGATGRESFVPVFFGMNLQDGKTNIKVRNQNDEKRKGKVTSSHTNMDNSLL